MPLRALVTGVGSNIGQGIVKALRLYDPGVFVVGTDARYDAVGLFACSVGEVVPLATDADFIDRMEALLSSHRIDVLLVASDAEVIALASARQALEANTGCRVLVCSESVARTCTDKWLTTTALAEAGLAVPQSTVDTDPGALADFAHHAGFPLVVKPRAAQGSKSVVSVATLAQLNDAVAGVADPIVQELVGRADGEYTVAVLTSPNGGSLASLAMRRRLAHGTTVLAEIGSFPQVRREAERVVVGLGGTGPMNVQLRMTSQGPVTLEVNPRFSGTTAMRALAGWNDVAAAVVSFLGDRPVAMGDPAPAFVARFYDEVLLPVERFRQSAADGRTIAHEGRALQSRLFDD